MAEPVGKASSALEKNDKAISEVMKELDLFIPSQDFETIVDETTMQNILQQWRRFTTGKRKDSEEVFDPSDFDRENFSEEQRDDLISYIDIFQREGNNDVEKKARIFFIQFVSVMYYIFIKVFTKDRTTDKHMKFAFNLARKVQEFSSVYVKVIG